MKLGWIAPAALVSVAAMLLVAGCGGGGSGSSGVQMYLSDAPIDAKAVDITISRIDVSKDGEGWTTLKTFTPELTLNLLDYRHDGNELTPDQYLLADAPLEAGHYTQIRLILTKVELEDNDGNRSDVLMSSQDTTGLKLIGEFDVATGTKSAVLIDFDAGRSIVTEGTGAYRLKPTVRVVPLQITGSIAGTVVFRDAAGEDIAVPEGVSIVATQGGIFVASSPVIEDGTFQLPALIAGSYDLELEWPEGTAATHAIPDPTTVSVTVGVDTDTGTIIATPLP